MAYKSVETRRKSHLEYYHRNKEKHSMWAKEYRARLKDECYQAYGGYKCVCCGEEEKSFLTIDHTNNDGASHRKEIKQRGGIGIYTWLRRNGFPEGFQILCWNCQQGKRFLGTCPHQERLCPTRAA